MYLMQEEKFESRKYVTFLVGFIFFAFVERFVELPEDHVIPDQLEERVVVGEQHQRLRNKLVPLGRPERSTLHKFITSPI